jgi:hypothetical protein
MSEIPAGKYTGCLERTTRVGEGEFALYGSDGTPPMLSKRQLDTLIRTNGALLLPHHKYTIDQARQSSCCGSAGVGALMIVESFEEDSDVVLAQASPYAFDGVDRDGNLIPRRSDNGMNIESCLRVLQVAGACSVKDVDQYDWRREDWPDDWREKAAKHRIAEAWDCPDEQAMLSAIAHGFPVVYGTNGHAVIGIGYDSKGVIILNSWGYGWGDNGIGRWPTHQLSSYGAWALRCTVADDAPRTDTAVDENQSNDGGYQRRRRRRRRR